MRTYRDGASAGIGGVLMACLLAASLLVSEEASGLAIRRSSQLVDDVAGIPPGASLHGKGAIRNGSRESKSKYGKSKTGRHEEGKKASTKTASQKKGDVATLSASDYERLRDKTGAWRDYPYGQFRPAPFNNDGHDTHPNRPKDDPTGLAPAEAPGVSNALGEGFDPQFLTVPLQNGSQLFVTPDVNFGLQAFLRASTSLDDLYRDEAKNHVIYDYPASVYPEGVGTEAADIVRWRGAGGAQRYLYTVSAVADDTMRSLLSKTDDVLGEYEDLGRITLDGQPLKGFDPHVIVHPNGRNYLTWSNHEFVQIVELSGPNTAVGKIGNLVSYGVNTEAPTSWFYPNLRNGSQTLNLAYAEGIFSQSNYNTRVLYQDVSADPLDPAQWWQRGAPTLSSSSSRGVFGPGSGSFFAGPDGRTWFAYGAFADPDGADNGKNDRFVRVQVAPADEGGVWVPTQVVETPKTY